MLDRNQFIICSCSNPIELDHVEVHTFEHWKVLISKNHSKQIYCGESFIFIGTALDADSNCWISQHYLDSLLIQTKEDLFQTIFSWCGAFSLLWKFDNEWICLHDAAGIQEMYYYQEEDSTVFSNALNALLEIRVQMGLDSPTTSDIPNHKVVLHTTHYIDIQKIIPNHYYSIAQHRQFRFYPSHTKIERSEEEIISEVSRLITNTLQLLQQHYQTLSLAVTGGFDSRLLLSLSRESKQSIELFFVNHLHSYAHLDLEIVKKIEQFLDEKILIYDFDSSIPKVPYKDLYYQDGLAYQLLEQIYEPYFKDSLLLIGSISEISRRIYRPYPKKLDANDCIWLQKLKPTPTLTTIFTDWQNGFDDSLHYDILDFLYWEHRMSNWIGGCYSLYSLKVDTFYVFNNRMLLDVLLSGKEKDRQFYSNTLYQKIMEKHCKGLSRIPYVHTADDALIKWMQKLGLYGLFRWYKVRKK